jgi:hypothetical protein
MPYMNFEWNGDYIADIHAWCRERGEQMVRVRRTWTEPNVIAGRFEKRVEITEMPEAFFKCMRFGGPDDVAYTEIERYDP